MIDDLDRTLDKLLRHELPSAIVDQVSISFATPDNEFPPPSVTLPAIDLFLYDIRENTELRNTQWNTERQLNGTATRTRSPIRVDCSYLITAWSSDSSNARAFDEHRLLSETMRALLRNPTIPGVLLQGSLRGQEPPLPASTLQPGRLQNPAEFWTALRGKPKASLTYMVTIGVVIDGVIETEPPVLERTFQFGKMPAEANNP
jgi:hypothetical protein